MNYILLAVLTVLIVSLLLVLLSSRRSAAPQDSNVVHINLQGKSGVEILKDGDDVKVNITYTTVGADSVAGIAESQNQEPLNTLPADPQGTTTDFWAEVLDFGSLPFDRQEAIARKLSSFGFLRQYETNETDETDDDNTDKTPQKSDIVKSQEFSKAYKHRLENPQDISLTDEMEFLEF